MTGNSQVFQWPGVRLRSFFITFLILAMTQTFFLKNK